MDLYKQIKLAKTLEFKHNTGKKKSNMKATGTILNFLSFKNKKERYSKTVKLIFITLHQKIIQ